MLLYVVFFFFFHYILPFAIVYFSYNCCKIWAVSLQGEKIFGLSKQ